MRGFLSDRAAVRSSGDLLELVTELLDAHADTVELLLRQEPDELERWAHCEYLRALQRLGHATLADHDRPGERPLGRTAVTRAVAIVVRATALTFRKPRGPRRPDELPSHHA